MKRRFSLLLTVVLLLGIVVVPGLAQSTTKSLSTNFTLVNLGDATAAGEIQYVEPDGTQWKSPDSFTLDANGGQAIYRQYDDPDLPAGRGSVVVSADQPIAAVTQIQARNQNPTSMGAYSGLTAGDTAFYVPLVAKNGGSASGVANSQIVVQNVGSASVSVEIELIKTDGTSTYTKSGVSIEPNASFLYDLAEEADANVPDSWFGSAAVRVVGSGSIVVVSNFFTGDAMQTFNAFPASAPGDTWYVPLFTARLSNSLSTPVAVQNLSGAEIPVDDISLDCTFGGSDPSMDFSLTNDVAIVDSGAYYFNPVTNMSIPEGFYGSCVVTSASNADVVSFVQMRFIDTGEAAAYEAINAGGGASNVIVPLVAKRLGNGFATAVTIQNLSATEDATVTLTYKPSGGGSNVVISDVVIPAGESLIQNHRTGDVAQLSDGWVGSLVVEGQGTQPIAAFVQLTFLRSLNPGLPSGDNFMAHNAFSMP